MTLKSGGDAMNMAGAGSMTGNADSAGVGVGTGVLAGMGIGAGLSEAFTGNAMTEQNQEAVGGDTLDNTKLGGVNIDT